MLRKIQISEDLKPYVPFNQSNRHRKLALASTASHTNSGRTGF